ncbi:MAG TPA: bifunctional riboflavin kinase/FAD synthetase [Actinomycetota bacterium]|jgi:riboflavin kinase/FMN adenylyltransferase
MNVVRGLADLPRRRPDAAVSIGNFDGVHRGHRALIRRLLARAEAVSGVPTVVTFDPHPQQVLRGAGPPALVTPERKIQLLASTGIERLVVLPFDRALSLVEPEDFVERILLRELKAKAVVVGANFRFGHFARGDAAMLRSMGRRLGFGFESVKLAELEGRRLSSTEIRKAIAEGDLRWAAKALGRPYAIQGFVVRGTGRGQRLLGYPTANLEPVPGLCLPATGIYAGYFNMAGSSPAVPGRQPAPGQGNGSRRMQAAVSVGTNPTFGENPLSIEAFVLDYHGDLYGRTAEIELAARIRDEERFDTPDALAKAIEADVVATRRILSSRAPRAQ